jgi:hypothetical protein
LNDRAIADHSQVLIAKQLSSPNQNGNRMRKILTAVSCCIVTLVGIQAASGQNSIQVPGDSKFVLQVDLQALKSSKLGMTLFDAAKSAAMKEVGKNLDSKDLSVKKVHEMLGMDPFEEIQGLVLCSSEYENPEKSMLGMVRLKKNTGNIEGLLLNLPDYSKTEHRNYEIHSAKPDEHSQIFGSIHKASDGNHTFVVGVNRDAVTSLLDSLDARTSKSDSLKSIELQSDRKVLASIQLMELPVEQLGKGPQANIAGLLKSLALSVTEQDDDIEVRAAMQTSSEKKANQIRQAFQGLTAMVELFASLDEDGDEDMQQIVELVKKSKIIQDGTSVSVKMTLPSKQIADLVKKELDDQ